MAPPSPSPTPPSSSPGLAKSTVLAALDAITHPASGRGLVDAGAVAKCAVCDGYVTVALALSDLSAAQQESILSAADSAIRRAAAEAHQPLSAVAVQIAPSTASPASPPRNTAPAPKEAGGHRPISMGPPGAAGTPTLPDVKHVIAVGAGKGGVGKSTIAVNLAVGLGLRGHAVGLLDGDIYGPSIPTMLGLHSMQPNAVAGMLQPFLVHGIKTMTIGALVDPERPLIWRGPMAHGAFKQLVEQTQWGPLDYLIVDLPPGTGDVSLTLAQTLRLSGAVVVCTPQRVAQDDAIRALRMFQQLNIDILGVVENMSYFIGDDGKEYDLFGRGGAQHMAQRTGVPFLGSLPITMSLRENCDDGNPSANFRGGSPLAGALDAIVQGVESQVAIAAIRAGRAAPTLNIS